MMFRNHRHILLFLLGIIVLSEISTSAHSTEIHPCVLYTRAETAAIQSRLDTEPYHHWFSLEQDTADNILSLNIGWDQQSVTPQTKAFYARVLACVWAFSDSTHEQRPAWKEACLLSLYHMPHDTYSPPFTSDLDVSEAAVYWAEAYDILKGAGCDFILSGYGDLESAIRENLKSLRDYMARDSFELFPDSPRIGNDFLSAAWIGAEYSDNHHVKLNAALAVVCLVIADESGSGDGLAHGLARLRGSLANLTVPDGAWAEGPGYLLYSAHDYVAAVHALQNTGTADLYDELPGLVETHMMLPHMVMPDGYLPPWDDSRAELATLAGLLWSHHAGRPDRDLLHWLWTAAGSPVPSTFRVDYLMGFDQAPPVYGSPDEYGLAPSGFYPESGFARFRSDWSDDAVYLLLQGEHGALHTSGRAHEHPDANSFLLHAFGELLIMDTGYGGWNNRDFTKYAEHHNLILVDGNGPPAAEQPFGAGLWSIGGTGASISDSFTDTVVDYAVSEAEYENTVLTRHVAFPDHRYFILYDTVESWDTAEFTLLLHGNGGGSSGGTYTPTQLGAVWTHGQASLTAAITGSTGNVVFSSAESSHAVYDGSTLKTHTVLRAAQTESAAAFLTVLYPSNDDVTAPVIAAADVAYGSGLQLTGPDDTAYTAIRSGVGDIAIRNNQDTVLKSDAGFVWCDTAGTGSPQNLFLVNGSYISGSDGDIVSTSRKVTLTCNHHADNTIDGYIQTDEPTELAVSGITADAVLFRDAPVAFSTLNNQTMFTVTGSGGYRITAPQVELILTAPAGSDTWSARDQHAITWTASGVETIDIAYSLDNGHHWSTIAESIPASNVSYSWDPPDTSSAQCRVRITDAEDVTVTDQSDESFTIYLPSVTLTSPNGGEEWEVFSTVPIMWTSQYVNTVNIEYSLDNGTTWETFAEYVPADTGSHEVSVPYTTATECLVRVTDTENGSVSDQSDSTFTMRWEKGIVLVTPDGGEEWISGQTYNLHWTSQGIFFVRLEYSADGGETWTLIADTVPELPDEYVWTVPGDMSADCYIRVSDATDTEFADTNNEAFTITPKRLVRQSPGGGEEWNAGASNDIRWSSIGIDSLKIEYSLDGGENWQIIEESIPAEPQVYVWTVPDTTSTDCHIRVTDTEDSTVTDQNDTPFIIYQPMITVSAPNGEEIWQAGTAQAITWDSEWVNEVRIEYSVDSGDSWFTIVTTTDAKTGMYNWVLPDNPSTSCLMRITHASDVTVSDESNELFTIETASGPASITLLSPNGGEQFDAGSTQLINWTSTSVDSLRIEYSVDGSEWYGALESVHAASGSQEWTLPDISSEEVRMRIVSTGSPAVFDITDGPFTISSEHTSDPRSVTILSPNGGEVWAAGTQQEILWEWSYIWDFNLEYSIDNGVHWTHITEIDIVFITAPENPSEFSYTWTVPDAVSTECLIRMRGISDPTVTDQSDAVYTIPPDDPAIVESEPGAFLAAVSYPNPFNPQTTISYQVPRPADVTITIYNALGQQVREYPMGRMEPGIYEAVFDAAELTSGLYFYRVDAGYEAVSGKMLYMK